MHVAAVGNRSRSAASSGAFDPPRMPDRCTQNEGASCENPSRGVFGHAVTNLRKLRCCSSVNSAKVSHSMRTVGCSSVYPPLYVAQRLNFPTSDAPAGARDEESKLRRRKDTYPRRRDERAEPRDERRGLSANLRVQQMVGHQVDVPSAIFGGDAEPAPPGTTLDEAVSALARPTR